jgi:hypothetical protein
MANTDAKASRAVVDHDCYTIANWDEQKRYAAPSRRRALKWAVATAACMFDAFGYYVQIASAEVENAFRH